MRKRFILIALSMLCLLPQCKSVVKKEDIKTQAEQIKASVPQEPRPAIALPIYYPLPESERLVYKAKFLGLSIGKFILINHGKESLKGREVYRFELIVKTSAFFTKLFKARDRYVSYMDTQKFRIVRHEEFIKDGTVLESVVDFDYDQHVAIYKNLIKPHEEKVEIPDQILDVMSGGYYLRMIPWQLGDTFELKIYADQKIYDFMGLFESQTSINLPPHGKQEIDFFVPYLFLNDSQIKEVSAEVLFSRTVPRKSLRAILKTILGNVSVVLEEESYK